MVAATVFHVKTATAPDDPTYNIVVGDWNSAHTVSAMLQPADFANSNGVTFGVNGAGVVTASVPAAGGAQTGISGIAAVGGTATSGTVSFANSNGVSWGLNGQSMTATVKTDYQTSGAYLTTAALSQDSSKYAGTSTGATNASVTLNTSGIAISVAAAAAQTSLSFVNSNGVTFGTAGSTLTATVATNYQSQGAYLTTAALSGDTSKYAQVWSLAGANTAGTTTQNIGSEIYFSGGNNVTISGNVSTLVFSIPNVLTTARGSTDAIGLNTAGTNITWTANSSGLSINNAGLAGTTTAITGAASITLNSAGLNFNIGPYITTADLSQNSSLYMQSASLVGANTAGTTTFAVGTRLNLSGGQGITLSGNVSTIVFSVGSYITTARASTDALGLNTAGTNITWTANSSGLSINAGGYAGTGTSATNASITLNTNGLAISVAAPGGGATYSYWNNGVVGQTANGLQANSIFFWPINLPYAVSASYLRMFQSLSATSTSFGTTANTTFSASNVYTYFIGVYSLGTGASSLSLMSVTTTSAGSTVLVSLQANANGSQYTVSYDITYPSLGLTTANLSTNVAVTNASFQISTQSITNFTAFRYLDIPFATVLTPGPYWLGYGISTSSGGNGAGGLPSFNVSGNTFVMATANTAAVNIPNAATNSSNLRMIGQGALSSAGSVAAVNPANLTSHTLMPFIELIRLA